jgi:hypothetical protein
MKLLLDENRLDRIVANWRRNMVVGIALMSLPFILPNGWGIGGLTGFMILSLGIYAAALDQWRTEPGLWMLALILTVVQGGSWGYFECLSLQSIFDGQGAMQAPRKWAWEHLRFSIDSAVAIALFGEVARFVASVAVANWRLTQSDAKKHAAGGL